MHLPRRLFLTASGQFCEADDVRQATNFHPAGYPIPDAEAERTGLKAYLDETGWGEVARTRGDPESPPVDTKAVDQAETEDKAVDLKPEESHAGLHVDTETRRRSRG